MQLVTEHVYTPGPLTIVQSTSTRYDEKGDYAIVDNEGKIIGEAFALVAENTYRPALTNARLWAAAPDLLAACEAAHRALVGWAKDEANADMFPTALFTLNDAIAKARGAQP